MKYSEENKIMKNRLIIIVVIILVFFGGYYLWIKNKTPASNGNNEIAQKEKTQNISAIMKTNLGDIKLELFPSDAPKTAENFVKLSESDFYDGVKFHRVIKDFMIQGGDPNSKDDDWSNDGRGGPGYVFQDEFNQHKLVKGSLAMANSGPNTNGSQFFIVTAAATSWLDGKHTNFGYVTGGLDIAEKIEKVAVNANDHPTTDVVINSVEPTKTGAENKPVVGPELPPDARS